MQHVCTTLKLFILSWCAFIICIYNALIIHLGFIKEGELLFMYKLIGKMCTPKLLLKMCII
uniref:G-protein coupled receptors family 1 profile domain-containing protein n=1 Tax=Anguilla anguilla TaxID=7936 RepID=A0A0E9W9C8_ANGAN